MARNDLRAIEGEGKDYKGFQNSSYLEVYLEVFRGSLPPVCGRRVVQTLRKWQVPSECGRPVQNVATQFALSLMKV